MKNKLTNNFGLKIVAVFLAAVLWFIVVNVDDPVDSLTFRDVPVTVTNEEVITNTGKIYQIENNTQTVTVVVSAPRSVLSKLSKDKIIAVADMREMELKSLVPITAYVDGYETKAEAVATPRNLQVKIEDQTKATFPISVSTGGSPNDGHVLGEMKANPEIITIRGPESLVANIDKAVAKVDVSGLGWDAELSAELILYDTKGNVIDQTLLTNNLGALGLTVDVTVLDIKRLPFVFETSGTPAEGYMLDSISCVPEVIEVYGTDEALLDLESIIIPADALDISGADGKLEISVDVSEYLPEDVEIAEGSAQTVTFTISIEQIGTKTIEFPVEAIEVNNLSGKLKISYAEISDLQLQFRGSEDALAALDIRNAVSIDLKKYHDTGTFEIPVGVEIPDTVELLKEPTIKIVLTEKE